MMADPACLNGSSGGSSPDKESVDIFRDTPVRLLGYANEVGEAFRNVVPKFVVIASYVVASGYAFCDASSKAWEVYEMGGGDSRHRTFRSIEMFAEAAIWQGLASVIIPGFTINRICLATKILLSRYASTTVKESTRNVLITGTGLGAIPMIIKPIDSLVDKLMEEAISFSRRLGISHSISHERKFHEILEHTQENTDGGTSEAF